MVPSFSFDSKDKDPLPAHILRDQGNWFLIYIVAQYVVYFVCKLVSIVITNKLEAELEERKLQYQVDF